MSFASGSVVRPLSDGEDQAGRVLVNTRARFVVRAAYTSNGRAVFDAFVTAGSGIYPRGTYLTNVPEEGFVVVDRAARKASRVAQAPGIDRGPSGVPRLDPGTVGAAVPPGLFPRARGGSSRDGHAKSTTGTLPRAPMKPKRPTYEAATAAILALLATRSGWTTSSPTLKVPWAKYGGGRFDFTPRAIHLDGHTTSIDRRDYSAPQLAAALEAFGPARRAAHAKLEERAEIVRRQHEAGATAPLRRSHVVTFTTTRQGVEVRRDHFMASPTGDPQTWAEAEVLRREGKPWPGDVRSVSIRALGAGPTGSPPAERAGMGLRGSWFEQAGALRPGQVQRLQDEARQREAEERIALREQALKVAGRWDETAARVAESGRGGPGGAVPKKSRHPEHKRATVAGRRVQHAKRKANAAEHRKAKPPFTSGSDPAARPSSWAVGAAARALATKPGPKARMHQPYLPIVEPPPPPRAKPVQQKLAPKRSSGEATAYQSLFDLVHKPAGRIASSPPSETQAAFARLSRATQTALPLRGDQLEIGGTSATGSAAEALRLLLAGPRRRP